MKKTSFVRLLIREQPFKAKRREQELSLLNKHADKLNAEGEDSACYQASWTPE